MNKVKYLIVMFAACSVPVEPDSVTEHDAATVADTDAAVAVPLDAPATVADAMLQPGFVEVPVECIDYSRQEETGYSTRNQTWSIALVDVGDPMSMPDVVVLHCGRGSLGLPTGPASCPSTSWCGPVTPSVPPGYADCFVSHGGEFIGGKLRVDCGGGIYEQFPGGAVSITSYAFSTIKVFVR